MQSEDPPPSPSGQPITPSSSVVYPKLLLSSAYDLSSDPIHKYTKPDTSSVRPPGYEHEYQLACEVPAHLWPHNAEKVGMVRFLPRPEGFIASKKFFVYQNEAGDVISVYPGFLYTKLDLLCVQYMWDSPGPDNTWPNRLTNSITARACLHCFMQTGVCNAIGCHILQPSRPRLIINDALAMRLQTERSQDRAALTRNGEPPVSQSVRPHSRPLKTKYGNKFKPTASVPSSLGKRRRPDSEAPKDTPQDSGGISPPPAPAPSVVPPDPFSLTLKRVQRTIERTIKDALETRKAQLQDVEMAMKEATSAKQRESDAESRRTVVEGRLQAVTSELQAANEKLLGAEDPAVTAQQKLAESNRKLVDSC
ncbi:hypothetical protein EHS25_000668 [Saitozyma podzolica]|uniref:Uncharacterized protein n=1 Tax=Saitozyma podzolica TaxID=1890683 RepID=A0A427YWZ0_9TREE|nr:hypothetical protein EHS25_000668 [Saitozyma podzolica]